jgi:hypothetical protein
MLIRTPNKKSGSNKIIRTPNKKSGSNKIIEIPNKKSGSNKIIEIPNKKSGSNKIIGKEFCIQRKHDSRRNLGKLYSDDEKDKMESS